MRHVLIFLTTLMSVAATNFETTVTVLYELVTAERTTLGDTKYISIKELEVTEPNTKVKITRDDLWRHETKVLAIVIENNICHYFPRGFEKYFKQIRSIAVMNSELKVITRNDIRPFPEIEDLHLNDNRLTSIEPKLFVSNRNLRKVIFANNRIREISPDIFDYFHDDCQIEFADNVCIQRRTKSLSVKAVTIEIMKKCQQTRQEIADNCNLMSEKWFAQP